MQVDTATQLSIGDLAKRTGLSVKLIRHWSDIGIVPPTERSAAGYRYYDVRSLARLELARTLRELGLGMAAIRAVVDRERGLAEAASIHADAIEAQIRTLRLQQAVLRSVASRESDAEELAVMTKLARLSAAERNVIIHDFVVSTLGDLDVPTYRDGLLAAKPDLPADPTAEQVDAWIELAELVRTPDLREAMRRMAEYAADHAPGVRDPRDLAGVQQVTDLWVSKVSAAMHDGIMPDSPAADPLVAEIVEAWIPTQARTDFDVASDGAPARRTLLEQLEVAAEPTVELYWRLICTINGWPAPPDLGPAGRWLMTALRTHAEPGARAAKIAEMSGSGDEPRAATVLADCARILTEVGAIVAAVRPDQLGASTPCAGWDVRALLNHLVYENLMWTSLAVGSPRGDFEADHLGDDPARSFRAAARATLEAFGQPGMTSQQYGPAPGWRLVEQVIIEMLVHGWDLAKATGRSTDLAREVATTILPSVREIYGDLPRTPGGSFAPVQPVPDTATAADRVAAYLGRVVA